MIDATYFIPREYHKGLVELGKTNWLEIKETTTNAEGRALTHFHIREDAVNSALDSLPVEDARRLVTLVEAMTGAMSDGSHGLNLLYAVSRLLAEGVKVYCPTREQFDALANVSVDLELQHYQQPFPVVVVQMPSGVNELGPKAIAVLHDSKLPMFTTVCDNLVHGRLMGEKRMIHSTFLTSPTRTMESVIFDDRLDRLHVHPENSLMAYRRAERVAVNCCLLLTQYRTRLDPADPKHAQKLHKLSKSSDEQRRERAKLLQVGEPKVITFEQQVRVHDVQENEGAHRGEPTGLHVKPHWRRGHWRRQRCGAGMQEHKLVFIRPILVRRDLFGGDASNTSAVYRPSV